MQINFYEIEKTLKMLQYHRKVYYTLIHMIENCLNQFIKLKRKNLKESIKVCWNLTVTFTLLHSGKYK